MLGVGSGSSETQEGVSETQHEGISVENKQILCVSQGCLKDYNWFFFLKKNALTCSNSMQKMH